MKELTASEIEELVNKQLGHKERPDQMLLRRVIETIEENTGEFDFEDTIPDGDIIVINDKNVVLDTLKITLEIPDSVRDPEDMWSGFFEPAAFHIVELLEKYNVCRPYGIPDNNLTAREGVLQLYKNGEKVSVYLSHKFVDDHTNIKLIMLVGAK